MRQARIERVGNPDTPRDAGAAVGNCDDEADRFSHRDTIPATFERDRDLQALRHGNGCRSTMLHGTGCATLQVRAELRAACLATRQIDSDDAASTDGNASQSP